MAWVAIVSVLALVEYLVIQGMVGRSRGKHGIEAPLTHGHPEFERWFRVQANTVEQLVVFLPALWLCAYMGTTTFAAIAGAFFVVGRALYAVGYVQDPAKRTIGFVLGYLAIIALVIRAGLSAMRML